MSKKDLSKAKSSKNDEFYTRYTDIQTEMNAYLEYNPNVFKNKTILLPCDDPEWSNFTKFFAQNFERFGLKKLISTSYAMDKKKEKYEQYGVIYQLSLFETESPKFDEQKSKKNGKVFILDKDDDKSGRIDINDLKWDYLEGDGDFRSDEVKKLRDEADIIITNPPFSIWREFFNWIIESNKQFIIMGNKNAISYKEVFPLIQNNKIWIGHRNINSDFWLQVPNGCKYEKIMDGVKVKHIMACWWTNIEHGKRHRPLELMTYDENIKYSKHKEVRNHEYLKYDNYDAIDIPFVDAIPRDYNGSMGVPITFIGDYDPSQFELIKFRKGNDEKDLAINGKNPYFRIIIRRRDINEDNTKN